MESTLSDNNQFMLFEHEINISFQPMVNEMTNIGTELSKHNYSGKVCYDMSQDKLPTKEFCIQIEKEMDEIVDLILSTIQKFCHGSFT